LITLNELAAALGDDPNFATTTATSIGLKAPLASPTFTGTATIPTVDINAGTIDGTVIGGTTAAAISGTTGQFGTSLNVDGTATMDGLTVDGAATIQDATSPSLRFLDTNAANSDFTIYSPDGANDLRIKVGSAQTDAFEVASNGDISFYEDTGTTAKFFWDASAESLGIGTSSPSAVGSRPTVHINGAAGAAIRLSDDTGNTYLDYTDGSGARLSVNAAEPLLFQTSSLERMRIDSSGNLLVGTTNINPSQNAVEGIALSTGSYGGYLSAARNGGVVAQFARLTNDGSILDFRNSTASVGSIGAQGGDVYISSSAADHGGLRFASGSILPLKNGALNAGEINLGQASGNLGFKDLYLSGGLRGDTLTFGNNAGTERMRIDASGNLLVGKSSIAVSTDGIELNASDYLAVTRDGGVTGYFNRRTSDGAILEFRKDNTTVGSIGTASGDLHINGPASHSGLRLHADTIIPLLNNTNSDGTIDLGYATGGTNIRFRDLKLTGGVYLGGTGAANKLDDYEEGTWTPAFSTMFGTGRFANATALNTIDGKFTKVGNLVTCIAEFKVTGASGNIANSDNFSITHGSLPFTPQATTGTLLSFAGTITAYGTVGTGANAGGHIIALRSQTVFVLQFGWVSGVVSSATASYIVSFQYHVA
jgi:hypothetical protein